MELEITIEGAEKVAANYIKRAKEVPGGLQRAISKVALLVERYGKTYSPVDTGLMRSTIYPVNVSTMETWVGPKTFYAKYVHARVPFMFAARQDVLPSVQDIIKEEVKKILN